MKEKIFLKINRISAFSLFFILSLYFLSGYAMTKNIFNPYYGKILHEKILPVPFSFFFLFHFCYQLRNFLLRQRVFQKKSAGLFSLGIFIILFSLFTFLICK